MNNIRTYKQNLAVVNRLREAEDYAAALTKVDAMLQSWPGNSQLHILWANLIQLQENTDHDLDEAKQAIQQAIELDKSAPNGAIELGHFLDNVEDNPQAAIKAYAEGISLARDLLLDGLIGQARSFLQLDKRKAAYACLMEVLHLQNNKPGKSPIAEIPGGSAIYVNGPFAEQIEELISELFTSRSV